jgi:hypothetical protein
LIRSILALLLRAIAIKPSAKPPSASVDGSGTACIENELSTGAGGINGITGWSINVVGRDASIKSAPDESVNGVGGSGENVNTGSLVARDDSKSDKLPDADKILGGSQSDDVEVANSGGIICKSTVLLPLTLRWISIDPSTSWPCAHSEAVDASVISAIDSTLMDLEWTGFIGIGNVYLLFVSSAIGDNPNYDHTGTSDFSAKSS